MTMRGAYAPGVGNTGPQGYLYDDQLSPGATSSLWYSCPLEAYSSEPAIGSLFFDDFIGLVTGATAWITTQAVSGTATPGALAGGTAALNAGAVTDHQGIQMQRAGGHIIPAAGKHIWFECRFKVNVLTTEMFFGLADIDTTIIAADAIHATDHISFSCITDDGVMLPKTSSASSVTAGAAATTLVAATYVRLGFIVNGVTSVTPYVNGVAGTAITANIPIVSLSPSFVCQATGTGTPQVDLDYVMVFQLR